jgi:MFS family permease
MFLVLLIALDDVAGGGASPALPGMIASFPDWPVEVIQSLVSLPSFAAVIVGLMFGKLTEKFSKRSLLFFGMIIFMIGGIAPAFLNSMPMIIIARAIIGFGLGITLPMSMNLIDDFWSGKTRDILMGVGNTSMAAIGGIIFQFGGGLLAVADWHHAYWVYLFPIIILVPMILWLPEPAVKAHAEVKVLKPEEQANMSRADKGQLTFPILAGTLIQILISAQILGVISNLPLVIVSEGLGDPATIGIVLSALTLATFPAGLFFGHYKAAFKKYYLPVSYIIAGLGVSIQYISHSMSGIIVGCVVMGLSMGLLLPGMYSRMSDIASKAQMSLGMGFVVVGQGFGQFIGPYYNSIVTVQILGLEIGRASIRTAAIGFITVGILWAIWMTIRGDVADRLQKSRSDIAA